MNGILTLLLVASAFVASSQGFSLRQMMGICVEMCSPDLVLSRRALSCPVGYVCRSNGCGHTCQLATSVHTGVNCLHHGMMLCDLYCPSGEYARDANGCTLCACVNPLDVLTQ